MRHDRKQPPHTFTGEYKRPDDGAVFVYQVTVCSAESGYIWFSRVAGGNIVKGRPSGKVDIRKKLSAEQMEGLVRDDIEAAIRDRRGLAEP